MNEVCPAWLIFALSSSSAAAQTPAVPAEAPLAMVRGRHRFRLLIHGQRSSDMQGFVRAMLANGPKERGSLQVQIDIDPQSFL